MDFSQSSLLTISQASRMLGVSEVTLRQWTDEGQIKAFVTPGGHRRYSEANVRRFIGTRHRVHGIKEVVTRMELAPAQEIEIAHTRFTSTVWYSELDQDSRDSLREMGRKMHNLIVTYVAKKQRREETLQTAREVGGEFGMSLAQMGLSLTDSIEAFLLHRAPLVSAVTDLMKKGKALNGRAAEAVALVSQITDEALLSLVEAYQNADGKEGAR
ncbi:MAG: helix-turn-helix domain-containing protein [Chloroflexota bacterium]|nr:helix-turn-helix domain-containing protein [Chloroflexota bacterium]